MRACKLYNTAKIKARERSYHLIALTYLAHREGLRAPAKYHETIISLLGREPTGRESRRPFLLLVHALVEDPTRGSPNIIGIGGVTRIVTALEYVERQYADKPLPVVNDILKYIRRQGGISGIYYDYVGLPSPTSVLNPDDIDLPNLGAAVVKTQKGYRLRLAENGKKWGAGEYFVKVRVGANGNVLAIGEDLDGLPA